jgi:hypothetical protein
VRRLVDSSWQAEAGGPAAEAGELVGRHLQSQAQTQDALIFSGDSRSEEGDGGW